MKLHLIFNFFPIWFWFVFPLDFPGGSEVKVSAQVQETWVWSLGREDSLEKEMATHSSILAWRIPVDGGAWRAIVHGVTKSWMSEAT